MKLSCPKAVNSISSEQCWLVILITDKDIYSP